MGKTLPQLVPVAFNYDLYLASQTPRLYSCDPSNYRQNGHQPSNYQLGDHPCDSFTSDLSKWQTGNVTDMSQMFAGASSFDSDLSKWQTGNVTDMSWMFCDASS